MNGLDHLRASAANYASLQGRISALGEMPVSAESAATADASKTPSASPSNGFDWRHEVVARALAQADGHDPDLKVVDVKSAKAGPFGSVAAGAVQPAWHCYLQMSAGIVGALAAAK